MKHLRKIKSEHLYFEVNEQIGIIIPNSQMGYVKAHILDIIVDNGIALIVFKYYSPYRKYWFYKIEDIKTIDMYNDDTNYINKCKMEYYANKNK